MTDHLLDRLHDLLAKPDAPDLQTVNGIRRGHVVTCAGRVNRRDTVLKPLLVRWMTQRCLDVDPVVVLKPARKATRPWAVYRRKSA